MQLYVWAGLLACLMAAGVAAGQTTQAVGAGRWEAVVRGLGSETFAEREAAQKVLDSATWRDAQALRILAEKTTDPEAKARLQHRAEALALEMLVHPPPVTLEVKDVGIKELAAALTTATGAEWTAGGREAGGPWTFKAQERPLWEVFRALEKQAAVHVQNSQGKVLLAPGPMVSGGMGPIDGDWTDAAAGDFLIYVGVRRGGPRVDLHPAGAPAVGLVNLLYGMRGDPRMRMARCAIPEFRSITDENGKILYTSKPRPTPLWISGSGIMPEVNTGMGFEEVAGMGKMLTIKGEMVVRSAAAVEQFEIPELTHQPSAPVTAGGRQWQMWAVDYPAGSDSWVINATVRPSAAPVTSVPMWVKVVDAAGKLVWEGAVDRQTSERVQPGAVKRPFKALIVAAKETKEEVVAFEIKDVPVPQVKR